MGGLLPSWHHFADGLNAVNRPAQMGPIWMEASHISGQPINNRIWIENPPASSYLACIAVKCIELQSLFLGEKYLRLLREAVMLRDENIALQSVLLKVAEALVEKYGDQFDLTQFKEDLKSERGQAAFRADLDEVQRRGINRFPSLVFSRANHPSLLITGYRPYTALLDVLNQLEPGIEAEAVPITEEAYTAYWGTLTKRELEEALGEYGVLKKFADDVK